LVARVDASTTIGWPDEDPDTVRDMLVRGGIAVSDWTIPADGYRDYLASSGYPHSYLGGPAGGNPFFGEKTLEHYATLALLDPTVRGPETVLIDVASNASPFAEILRRLRGWKVYDQDLQFPYGLHGERIGGDAAAMPVPDGLADVMTLHCSYDHFEGSSDIGFTREAARVLRPGGQAVILPLYLSTTFGAKCDPRLSWQGLHLDEGMRRYLIPRLDVRFSRTYDAARLRSRVLEPAAAAGMLWRVLRIQGGAGLVPHSYLNFALLLEKPLGEEP
jgi:SAM-dependent methyltransferase